MTHRRQLIEEILKNMHAVHHRIKTKSIGSKCQMPITSSQWFVLGSIENCKNLGIKDISKALGMSSSAITQLVDGLVQSDYVIRQENPQDRRSIQLKISRMGKEKLAAMKKRRIDMLAELFDVLSDSELESYLELHKKIASCKKLSQNCNDE